jgi:large subunit ribosomal protein L32
MIEPKKRTSKARRDKRRRQTWKIALPGLQACGKCGAPAPSHRVCKACDTYNGRVMAKAE